MKVQLHLEENILTFNTFNLTYVILYYTFYLLNHFTVNNQKNPFLTFKQTTGTRLG